MIHSLKKKWNIKSNIDFWLIMLVFSLAGMSITLWKKSILSFIAFSPQTPLAVKIMVYAPVFFTVYQIHLLLFGLLLGQFNFFFDKQKKIGRLLLKPFQRSI